MNKICIPNYPMTNPAPAVLVGAQVDGKANYAAVGAFGFVCMDAVFYISLKNSHYTTKGILDTGFFSVNLPAPDMLAKLDYCGRVSGDKEDKSCVFTSFYDERGKAPLVGESPVNYLCKVIQTTEIKGFTVFFGEILATFIKEDCLTDGKPDPVKISPVFMMAARYYGLGPQLGDAFRVPDWRE